MTFSELISRFLEMIEKERTLSSNTVRAYKNDLEKFNNWFFETFKTSSLNEMENLTLSQLRSFWAEQRKNGLSHQSMRRAQSSLRGIFKYAKKHDLVNRNPVESMESPRRQRPLPKALEKEELLALLHSPSSETLLGKRDLAILELLYGSGLRVSELADITFDQVSFSTQTARILGKGRKERIVPLTPSSCSALQGYISFRNAQQPEGKNVPNIFLNRYGTALTTRSIARLIDKHTRQMALMKNITPHQLRHSFATHLLDGGADIRAVQEMLGHENLSTTQIYTHISKEKLLKTYKNTHPRSGQEKKNDI